MLNIIARRLLISALFITKTVGRSNTGCSNNFLSCTSKFWSKFCQYSKQVCLHSSTTTGSSSSSRFPKTFLKEELRKRLTPQQYDVTQNAGTERAFTGEYWDYHLKGLYKCVVCQEDLFSSETKFESGSGWPSFYDVVKNGNVELLQDASYGMIRTEVLCASCGSHLGHMFEDGPKPTGQRYCINSASLKFVKKD